MKMQKYILALVGSRAGEGSNTRKLCELLCQGIRKETDNYSFKIKIMTAEQWNVKPCKSCHMCFREGKCVQDEYDGMSIIRREMLKADCIILASPVYAGMISGDMKVLIDRLSAWLHTMPLIGKIAIVLSTADNNHGAETVAYLEDIAQYMGMITVKKISVYAHYGNPILSDEKGIRKLIKESAKKVIDGLDGKINPSEELELKFKNQLKRYQIYRKFGEKYPELRIAEERIWDEQGYFNVSSFKELYERRG